MIVCHIKAYLSSFYYKITIYERYHYVKSKSKERVRSIINLSLLKKQKFLISIELS